MTVRILTGDCRDLLRGIPDESVHCVVTSPPYWGLRDYGTGRWEGGDANCGHKQVHGLQGETGARAGRTFTAEGFYRDECGRCGAKRIDQQIGLEADYRKYIATMVGVFREVRRVLRSDGTLWLNLGDSYATGAGKVGARPGGGAQGDAWADGVGSMTSPNRMPQSGLKPKDITGIPWRVAFALQDDGWWLRQDIIWAKPNPMPESVTDRCTKSHEYLFLLAKSEQYYFDQDAILEPATFDGPNGRQQSPYAQGFGRHTADEEKTRRIARSGNKERKPASSRGVPVDDDGSTNGAVAGSIPWEGSTRNKRSVWTVTTQPFKEAHFATFPPALIEPCILAGSPKGGLVLDPFGGAGTTGVVANRLGRDALLLELNPAYAKMARDRIFGPLFADLAPA